MKSALYLLPSHRPKARAELRVGARSFLRGQIASLITGDLSGAP